MFSQNVDFDAFTAIIDCSEAEIIGHLTASIDLSSHRPTTPRYGYSYGREIFRGYQVRSSVLGE